MKAWIITYSGHTVVFAKTRGDALSTFENVDPATLATHSVIDYDSAKVRHDPSLDETFTGE
jgi:hypothetical protein